VKKRSVPQRTKLTIVAVPCAHLFFWAWWVSFSSKYRRSFSQVSAAAKKIAAGDLAVSLVSESNRQDELGVLAATFTEMTDSLVKWLNS